MKLEQFSRRLKAHLILKNSALPVILCIGSDRVTGDCLGPLVGNILLENNVKAFVYGTLENPVNALNLVQTSSFIRHNHPKSLVIAIDSSLGSKDEIGLIRLIDDGIFPGAATGKDLPKVGDVSITATVALIKSKDLYSVRLGFVYDLAKKIANDVLAVLETNPHKINPSYEVVM